MIKHKIQANLTDVSGQNKVIVDVNFNKKYKDCIRFTIGNRRAVIPKAEIFQLLFTISNEIQQTEMIPVKTEIVKPFARKHMVKLEKDLKKGDTLVVHCEVNVASRVVEAIKKELENKKVA